MRGASVGLAIAAAACLLALPAVGQQDPAADRVDRYLDRLVTLRAGFRQEVFDAGGSLREEAEGTLALARPGRFRWDYRSPAEQLLVSDGRTIWLYDVELEQVTVRDAGQSLSATPAMLLSGRGRVGDSFSIADGGRADGLDWSVLTPRQDDTDFREMRLGFRSGELARMDLVDRLGQTTRIRFTAIERNPALPAGTFDFVAPAGVDVIGSAAPR